jgi:hypothetical protein
VVLRCLAKDPAHRFQSGEDLSEALKNVVTGLRETRSFKRGQPDVGATAPPLRPSEDSDPRYRVPSDKTLGLLSPTESDLGSEMPVEEDLPTEQVKPAPPPPPVGATTVGLARDINVGRRRFLLHGSLAAGSILFGSAVGATTYWVRGKRADSVVEPETEAAPMEPPPQPPPKPEPPARKETPIPEGTPPASATNSPRKPRQRRTRSAKAKKKTTKKLTTKKLTTKVRRPKPRPLGRVSPDHHSEEPPPRPAPKPGTKTPPKPPPPKPPPPRKNEGDDFYDLVD